MRAAATAATAAAKSSRRSRSGCASPAVWARGVAPTQASGRRRGKARGSGGGRSGRRRTALTSCMAHDHRLGRRRNPRRRRHSRRSHPRRCRPASSVRSTGRGTRRATSTPTRGSSRRRNSPRRPSGRRRRFRRLPLRWPRAAEPPASPARPRQPPKRSARRPRLRPLAPLRPPGHRGSRDSRRAGATPSTARPPRRRTPTKRRRPAAAGGRARPERRCPTICTRSRLRSPRRSVRSAATASPATPCDSSVCRVVQPSKRSSTCSRRSISPRCAWLILTRRSSPLGASRISRRRCSATSARSTSLTGRQHTEQRRRRRPTCHLDGVRDGGTAEVACSQVAQRPQA